MIPESTKSTTFRGAAVNTVLIAMASCATPIPAAAAPNFPDRGRAGVVDSAHVLSVAARVALNNRVVAWDRATGHQLAIVTVPDLQGLDISAYGYQLGRAWGLGDKQRKDGAILLLAIKERKVRIDAGYGLEPVLTDAATSLILRQDVVPKLKAGDIPGALNAGADRIMRIAQNETVTASDGNGHHAGGGWWPVAALIAAIGAMAAAFMGFLRSQRRHLHALATTAKERAAVRAARIPSPPPAPPRMRGYPSTSTTASRTAFVSSPTSPPPPAPRRSSYSTDDSSSSSSSSLDFGSSSSSSDSGSSSSGFDSGGGSFGGGGSDSSW